MSTQYHISLYFTSLFGIRINLFLTGNMVIDIRLTVILSIIIKTFIEIRLQWLKEVIIGTTKIRKTRKRIKIRIIVKQINYKLQGN